MEPNIPRKQRDSPICKICSTSLLLGLLIYSTEIPHANPLQISLSTYCIAFINSNIFVYDDLFFCGTVMLLSESTMVGRMRVYDNLMSNGFRM